jgi:hypothetical protein
MQSCTAKPAALPTVQGRGARPGYCDFQLLLQFIIFFSRNEDLLAVKTLNRRTTRFAIRAEEKLE